MTEQTLEPIKGIPISQKPEFDMGSVTIEYLSNSPDGFEVKTDKVSRRKVNGIAIPLDQRQKVQLKTAMIGQMKFTEGNKAKIALDKLRNANQEEKPEAQQEFEKRRRTYLERALPLVGVRNARRQGNLLLIDAKTTDYITYQEFGNPDSSKELLDQAVVSSTSMGLITKDNRLIIQHRSERNSMWGDVPGASVAGYFQGQFDYDPFSKRGIIIPIDTAFVKNNALKEAFEELGLEKEDFSKIKIVGLTHEKVKIHDEFTLFGESNLTAEEIREKALKASKNSKLSEEEFDEKFTDIPATPEAIVILLTEVKCPVPATHIGLFVALGYSMMIDKFGIEKANEWKEELQIKTQKNYKHIDNIVSQYYINNPDELKNIPDRYKNKNLPPRNHSGYNPSYLPREQGLPDFTFEMKRVGLIN